MNDKTMQMLLVEQRVANEGPNVAVAYLLWFFLGLVSAHRFYLGRAGSAILQILSYFIVVGFIWLLIDGFLIPGMIRSKQDEVRGRLMVQLMGMGVPAANPVAAPAAGAPTGVLPESPYAPPFNAPIVSDN